MNHGQRTQDHSRSHQILLQSCQLPNLSGSSEVAELRHPPSLRQNELQSRVREHVEAGAAIFSDEFKSYEGLESGYQHAVINHAVEY